MTVEQRVLVPLAEGFEEVEAVAIVDVLRRAGIGVTLAAVGDSLRVAGAHGLVLEADVALAEVVPLDHEMIALPGGMPGAATLRDDARVQAILRQLGERGRWTAALCAAPMALAAAGLLEGQRATSYPSFQDRLGGAEVVADEPVVVSGRVVTSRGPGTALAFALTLVAVLAGPEAAVDLAAAMQVPDFPALLATL